VAITPDNLIIGTYTVCIDDTDIGSTTGGCTVRYSPQFLSVSSDQYAGTMKSVRTSEQYFVTFTAQEVTLDLLRIALGYPSANLVGSVLTLGYNDGCAASEHTIAIKGPGPSCGCRTFEFYRAVSNSESEYVMNFAEEVRLAMEFEIMKDPNNSDTFGIVTDGCTYAGTVACA